MLGTLVASEVEAAPQQRHAATQRGDLVMIGNTLGHDCSGPPVVTPVSGTVGPCGTLTEHSAPDVFWSLNAAQTAATASTANSAAQASSLAVLAQGNGRGYQLPAGAEVTYARLYWSASNTALTTPNFRPRLSRAGVFDEEIQADDLKHLDFNSTSIIGDNTRWYQATADVTNLVRAHGTGNYAFTGIASRELRNTATWESYAAWSMVVVYQLPSEPLRNITIFDGLDLVDGNQVDVNFNGFVVPEAGFNASLGVIAYEGDLQHNGDQVLFGRTAATLNGVTNGLNPANNFFNSSRTINGVAISPAGDLPRTTGAPGSLSGFDIDQFDVTGSMVAGQNSAVMRVTTANDSIALGVTTLSISTIAPNFSASPKTVRNITRPNSSSASVGDVLEYTIDVRNTGNDASVNTVFSDPLPVGVNYVPGSLRVDAGPNTGAKTDAVDNDQGEYTAGNRTITVRLGAGANGTNGGRLEVNQNSLVRFRVSIGNNPPSRVDNLGQISAVGAQGNNQGVTDPNEWGTQSPDGSANKPTPIDIIDSDLDSDGDGLPDWLENEIGTDPNNPDTDGDGIPDGVEYGGPLDGPPRDTDGDGIIDALDPDDDGDGVPTKDELGPGGWQDPQDTDGDGKPDYLDADDDGDGVPTKDELGPGGAQNPRDTDGDGTPDYLDTDDDNDGVPTKNELGSDGRPRDTDGDGTPDHLDTDDDGDTIPTKDELGPGGWQNPRDTDGDGKPDYLDADDDGDGIPTKTEIEDTRDAGVSDDVDGDGKKNWHDTDADGDGKPDAEEGRGDDDGDGIPNYLDPDDTDGPKGSGVGVAVEGGGFSCSTGNSSSGMLGFGIVALAMLFVRRSRKDKEQV